VGLILIQGFEGTVVPKKQNLRLHTLVVATIVLAVLSLSCGQDPPSLDSRLFVLDLEEFPNSQSLVWWEDIEGPEDLGIEVWAHRSDGTTSRGLENGVYAEYRKSILSGSATTIIMSFKNMNAARKAYSLLAEPIGGGGGPDTASLYDHEREVFRSRIGEDSIVYDHQYQAYAPLGGAPVYVH